MCVVGFKCITYEARSLSEANFDSMVSSLEIPWARWLYIKANLSSTYNAAPNNLVWASLPNEWDVSPDWCKTMCSHYVPLRGLTLFLDLISHLSCSLIRQSSNSFCVLWQMHTRRDVFFICMIHLRAYLSWLAFWILLIEHVEVYGAIECPTSTQHRPKLL